MRVALRSDSPGDVDEAGAAATSRAGVAPRATD
jgi:hypothetical protein